MLQYYLKWLLSWIWSSWPPLPSPRAPLLPPAALLQPDWASSPTAWTPPLCLMDPEHNRGNKTARCELCFFGCRVQVRVNDGGETTVNTIKWSLAHYGAGSAVLLLLLCQAFSWRNRLRLRRDRWELIGVTSVFSQSWWKSVEAGQQCHLKRSKTAQRSLVKSLVHIDHKIAVMRRQTTKLCCVFSDAVRNASSFLRMNVFVFFFFFCFEIKVIVAVSVTRVDCSRSCDCTC